MKNKTTLLTILLAFVGLSINAQTWTQKAIVNSIAPRTGATGFSIGNKGYFVTIDKYGANQELWEWNSTTDTWTQKAPPNNVMGMESAVGFSIGTKGYILTGNGTALPLNNFLEYNQTTDSWSTKANFTGIATDGQVGFSIGNKGYIGTGIYTTGFNVIATKDFWEWDQASDIWTKKTDFGGDARGGAVGFSIGNKGYIGTGASLIAPSKRQDFWEWDQLTDIWSQKADFGGSGRSQDVGFSIGTNGYIGTGYDTTNTYQQDFWEWNQLTDAWSQKTDFGGSKRVYATGFSIGTKGYIGMGVDTTKKYDFWEYDTNATAINEINFENSISIFPNPFCTQTVLHTNNLLRHATLTVYNSFGQTVKQIKNISGQTVTLSRDNLASGLYFLRLTQDNKTFATDKLVITDN